jgi:hypothetical protein
MSVPSTHLFTSTAVLWDNEPRCVPYSLHTSKSSRGQIPREFSCSSFKEDHSSSDRNNNGTRPPLLLGMALITMHMRLTQLTCQNNRHQRWSHATLLLLAPRPNYIQSTILRLIVLLRTTSSKTQSRSSVTWHVFHQYHMLAPHLWNQFFSFKELQRGSAHICRETTLSSKFVLTATSWMLGGPTYILWPPEFSATWLQR